MIRLKIPCLEAEDLGVLVGPSEIVPRGPDGTRAIAFYKPINDLHPKSGMSDEELLKCAEDALYAAIPGFSVRKLSVDGKSVWRNPLFSGDSAPLEEFHYYGRGRVSVELIPTIKEEAPGFIEYILAQEIGFNLIS